MSYCPSIFQTKRFSTREVFVGKVAVGANNPIRIQSMTTFDACNIESNVEQILKLEEEGCEIVRLAVQGKKQVGGMEKIKEELQKKGCSVPLVADVHFFPEAAIWVADFADKVRINPGNFVAIRPEKLAFDPVQELALEQIEKKLLPLIRKCQKRGIPIRLGSNSGSLSERILYLYGNTPKGMVFSALEYAEICRKFDFHDLVFSMKASNPLSTIAAYRLLVAAMLQRGWNYPIHLGVTEAGEGEEGRIKSAVGIGSLLLDGIGDTIRVSLTENPQMEILPAKILAKMASEKRGRGISSFEENHRKPLLVSSRKGSLLFLKVSSFDLLKKGFSSIGCDQKLISVDGLYLEEIPNLPEIQTILSELQKKKIAVVSKKSNALCKTLVLPKEAASLKSPFFLLLSSDVSEWETLRFLRPEMIFFQPKVSPLHEARRFYDWMQERRLAIPFILDFPEEVRKELRGVYHSAEMGSLLCDGIGDGVLLSCPDGVKEASLLGLRIFQACRRRLSQTEFISCPGCGRTLFDIQSVVQELKATLPQFPGVKIAIMGCLVNGRGEMEDADFGILGSSSGLVDLYAKKKCVEKNIQPKEIKSRLIPLIKKHQAILRR